MSQFVRYAQRTANVVSANPRRHNHGNGERQFTDTVAVRGERGLRREQVGLRVGTGDVGLLVDLEAEARPQLPRLCEVDPAGSSPLAHCPDGDAASPPSPARESSPVPLGVDWRRSRAESRPMTSTFTLVSASDLSVRSLSANTIAAAPSSAQTDSVCCTSSIDSG